MALSTYFGASTKKKKSIVNSQNRMAPLTLKSKRVFSTLLILITNHSATAPLGGFILLEICRNRQGSSTKILNDLGTSESILNSEEPPLERTLKYTHIDITHSFGSL